MSIKSAATAKKSNAKSVTASKKAAITRQRNRAAKARKDHDDYSNLAAAIMGVSKATAKSVQRIAAKKPVTTSTKRKSLIPKPKTTAGFGSRADNAKMADAVLAMQKFVHKNFLAIMLEIDVRNRKGEFGKNPVYSEALSIVHGVPNGGALVEAAIKSEMTDYCIASAKAERRDARDAARQREAIANAKKTKSVKSKTQTKSKKKKSKK